MGNKNNFPVVAKLNNQQSNDCGMIDSMQQQHYKLYLISLTISFIH